KYRFILKWGEATDSYDLSGKITQTSQHRPSNEQIIQALSLFKGQIMQQPPRLSAVHINGQRAYTLARNNVEFTTKPKLVNITSFNYLESPQKDQSLFEITCSSGTYIRSIAHDFALSLESCGHVCHLTRLQSGPFLIENTISLDEFEKKAHKTVADHLLLPLETGLDGIPALVLEQADIAKIHYGQPVYIVDYKDFKTIETQHKKCSGQNYFVALFSKDTDCSTKKICGIGMIKDCYLYPKRLFNLNHQDTA
ncbi:MAG: hypothetical protein AAF403_03930, partial [Pseudomonadota bacterium]